MPCTCKEKEVEKHLDSCDGDCGCDDILNGDYVLERMKAHDEKHDPNSSLCFQRACKHTSDEKEGWEDEFEKLMPKTSTEGISYPQFCAVRDLIRTEIAKARESERQRVREWVVDSLWWPNGWCPSCKRIAEDLLTFLDKK